MTASTSSHSRPLPDYGEPIVLRQYIHWRRLIGERVQIRQHGQIIRIGTVDEAMADSTALWIAGDAVQPRTMYEAALGIEVWTDIPELSDRVDYRMASPKSSPDWFRKESQ